MDIEYQERQDLIVKYRPRRFDQFWHQEGTVSDIRQMFKMKIMPRGRIYVGGPGTGKTSMTRTEAYAIQCENPDGIEPCLSCTNCGLAIGPGFIGFDTRLIDGPSFTREALEPVIHDDMYHSWNPHNVRLCIVDEAHRIRRTEQERFLHVIEDVVCTYFIFCTTNPERIIDALHARCQTFTMDLPTLEETTAGLHSIAVKENLEISHQDIMTIAHQRNCIPRDCVKDLQFYRALGRLPDYPQDEMPIA